jgi:hypothetical protein
MYAEIYVYHHQARSSSNMIIIIAIIGAPRAPRACLTDAARRHEVRKWHGWRARAKLEIAAKEKGDDFTFATSNMI